MKIETYVVLEHRDYSGLTVDSFSMKPGEVFTNKQWNWGEDVLAAAVKAERCELVTGKESSKQDKKGMMGGSK